MGDVMGLTREQVIKWLRLTAQVLAENKDYLTELDAAIGDADHGINMERGFQKITSQLPGLEGKDLGGILKGVGMALVASVGGASGPLYGTLFLRAGAVTSGKNELNISEVAEMLKAGLAGVIERGKARLEDKTMIDALSPAVDTFVQAARDSSGLDDALRKAVDAAESGMKNTIPLQARKGRASYLGERSIGHQDPGATSSFLILRALYDVVTGKG
jgi:dihydroxyacetone kinase-like protein